MLCGTFVYTVEANGTYTVTPLVIDVEAEARDIIEKEITVTNTGVQPISVYPSVNNIVINDGGGIQEFLPAVMSDRTTSLASWVEISRAGIDLQAGQSKTLTLTLRVNPDPVPGEYHAFIGFGNGRNRDEAEAQVRLGDAPGVVLSVSVEDKKTMFLKLSRFFVDRFMTGYKDDAAIYKINNPSDEILTPTGEIIIYDSKGVEVNAVPLNIEGASVAPGEEKEFAVAIPSTGLFGKYKAYLDVEYGVQNKASVQDTVFFYALPVKILLPIFVCIVVLVIAGSFYIHKRYYDLDDDGSEAIHVHVRESISEAKEHDIDLKSTP